MRHQPTPTPNPLEQSRAYKLAALQELTEMALDLARRVHAQAEPAPAAPELETPEPKPPQPKAPQPKAPSLDEITITFDRIARTLRRTVALSDYLETKPLETTPPPIGRPGPPRGVRTAQDALRRRRLGTPGRYTPPIDRPEPALEDNFANMPDEELIAELREDIAAQGRYVWKHPGNATQTPPPPASHLHLVHRSPTKPKPRPQHE